MNRLLGTASAGLLAMAAMAVADAPVGPTVGPPSPPHILPLPISPAGVLSTDRASYAIGSPVRLRFAVKNTGKSPVRYEFSNAQQYDFAVADASGTRVWQWSTGRRFRPAASNLVLKPGQTRAFEAVWQGSASTGARITPGDYTVQAWLTSSPRPAITGGFAVNTDTDPTNSGLPRPNTDTGAVRAVDTAPPVFAAAKITIR